MCDRIKWKKIRENQGISGSIRDSGKNRENWEHTREILQGMEFIDENGLLKNAKKLNKI